MIYEPYISTKEAAGLLGVCTRTIKIRVAETRAGLNDFPFYQDKQNMGCPLRFKASELEAWRKAQAKRQIQGTLRRMGGLRVV